MDVTSLYCPGYFGLWSMVVVFIGYLLGVRVIEVISVRLRSITFIKTIHTGIFVVVSGLLFVFLAEVVIDRPTYFTWTTISLFVAEGVVLAFNRGRCPLTSITERLGSKHGQITDTFLPKWFADRVFTIYTVLFVGALAWLLIRVFQ